MSRGETAVERRYRQGPWDLSDLLPGGGRQEVEEGLRGLEEAVRALEAARGKLGPEMDRGELLEILRGYEGLVERMVVLAAFGALRFAADTQSEEALALRNRIEGALTGFQNRVLFLTLWWKGLGGEVAGRLLPSARESADLRHFLRDLRRLAPYTLAEREEQIINLKDADGIEAVLTLYAMLTNRLDFRLEVDGEERTLTRDELGRYFYSPRPELRAAAYDELLRVYRREAAVLGQAYVHRVRDWHGENLGLRGFASPLAVRNVGNDLPDAAVAALLEAVREEAGLFQRFFRLKARWLGRERLRRYDLYAPLTPAEREIPYPEAVSLVLETFGAFDPRFAAQAERVFAAGHVDSEIRKGKKGGGFCASVLPGQTPWVLLNYTGRLRDAATLAHELGHAVHSMMAGEHSVLTYHASLPLAETASVFAEVLVTQRLLREEGDPRARRELLAATLGDAYATVLRQAYFVRFELEAHRAVVDGASPEELGELYLGTLAEQFGDAVEVPAAFRHEWLAVPHLYQSPFYCYAYSFGQLLVLALYRRYQEEGEAFKPGYLRLLAHGGSAPPAEILAEAGIDPEDPGFWRSGFAVLRGWIEELEATDPEGS